MRRIFILIIIYFFNSVWGQTKGTINADKHNNTTLDSLKSFVSSLEYKNRTAFFRDIKNNKDSNLVLLLEYHLINDVNEEVRARCAQTLGYIKSRNSLDVITKAVNDTSNEVQMWSALALSKIGEKEISFENLKRIWETGERREKLFTNKGFTDINNEDAINFLIKATTHQSPYVSVDAAIQLATLKKKEIVFEIFERYLRHDNKHIRGAALRGLFIIGDEKAVTLIKALANDPNQNIRLSVKNYLNELQKR